MTKIEWTGKTWNPVVGCSPVSPGCANCYAMRMAARLEAMGVEHYRGLTKQSKTGLIWTGKIDFAPERVLVEPRRRKKATTYFVNSMGDLFHEAVSDSWIDNVFATMALCPHHIFQILTKRPKRMFDYVSRPPKRRREFSCHAQLDECAWPLPNVWLGVSCEDQKRADERIPKLLETPAAVRFISAEPLLDQLDLRRWMSDCYECGASCGLRLPAYPEIERCEECGEEFGPDSEPVFSDGCPKCGSALEPVCPDCGHYMVHQHPDTPCLDWIICGGESGPGARPMHPDWVRSLRDQCQAARVPFFFKQHGEWVSVSEVEGPGEHYAFPDGATVRRTGKKLAGRLLDGRTWDETPARKPAERLWR